MKSRIIWAVVLISAIAGFNLVTIRPASYSSPGFSRKRPPLSNLKPPEAPPPTLPPLVIETPALKPLLPEVRTRPLSISPRDGRVPMQMELPIQDKSTIDYSNGGAVVRSGGNDQEAL